MSEDLTQLDDARPAGLSDLVSADPTAQRLTRQTLVDHFGTEHHLTGEHKIPSGSAFDKAAAADGQLYLHDAGLLMVGNAVFPVGSVRELTQAVGAFFGSSNSSTPIVSPGFDPYTIIGSAPYNAVTMNAFVGAPAGARFGSSQFGSTTQDGGKLERMELPVGTYALDGIIRYVTGANGAGGKSLRLRITDADGTEVFSMTQGNLALAAYSASNPASHGRVELTPAAFTIETASDYFDLSVYGQAATLGYGIYSTAVALSVIGWALRLRRTA